MTAKETYHKYYLATLGDHENSVQDKAILPAMKEYARIKCEEQRKEIIEALEKMSNGYEVIGGDYVISKNTIDHYIESLDAQITDFD